MARPKKGVIPPQLKPYIKRRVTKKRAVKKRGLKKKGYTLI